MQQQTIPDQSPFGTVHTPSIPGMVVDAFDAASLAVALVSAFAIKFVAAAVTK